MNPTIALGQWRNLKSGAYHAVNTMASEAHLDIDAQKAGCHASTCSATPRPLKKGKLILLGESLMLLFPVCFIGKCSHIASQSYQTDDVCVALAATAWSLHGKPVSERGETMKRVALFGPTIFPLVFAALGGRSMKNIALWTAERGSTIGVSPYYPTNLEETVRLMSLY